MSLTSRLLIQGDKCSYKPHLSPKKYILFNMAIVLYSFNCFIIEAIFMIRMEEYFISEGHLHIETTPDKPHDQS
jgi:hypothetical protein